MIVRYYTIKKNGEKKVLNHSIIDFDELDKKNAEYKE
jgi:hypothetical protein